MVVLAYNINPKDMLFYTPLFAESLAFYTPLFTESLAFYTPLFTESLVTCGRARVVCLG